MIHEIISELPNSQQGKGGLIILMTDTIIHFVSETRLRNPLNGVTSLEVH